MLYGKINNDGLKATDLITEKQLREKFTEYSFPRIIEDSALQPIGYVKIDALPTTEMTVKELSTHILVPIGVKQDDGTWLRDFELEEVDRDRALRRWATKWNVVYNKAKKALLDTEYTQTSMHPYQKEYKEYRDKLIDIIDNNTLDPYLIEMPTLAPLYGEGLDGAKDIILRKAKAKFKKSMNTKLDTGFGFFVDASMESLQNLYIGRRKGLLHIRAFDNIIYDVTEEQFDAIINQLEDFGLQVYQNKWLLEDAIKACTTIEELELLKVD